MRAGDRYLLLVNPSAGGGRGAQAAAASSSARCATHGLEYRHRAHRRASSTAAARRAAAAEPGEIPVVMSGDGLIGQVGGALAGTGAADGRDPRRPRQRLRAGARDPDRARGARSRVLAAGTTREIDVGEVNGKRFLCIASCGFDSDANRIANEAQAGQGQPRLRLRGAAGAGRLEAGDVHAHARRRAQREFTGYTVAAANSKAYGGGMFVAPDAELDDGLLDVVATGRRRQAPLPAQPAEGVQGRARREILEVRSWRARRGRIEADRPFAVYADGDHLADLPATVTAAAAGAARDRPGMSAARRRAPAFAPSSRSRRATGGAQPAQRPRRRHDAARAGCCCGWRPTRSRASARELSDGSTIVSATNGKTTTAGMIAAALRAAGRDPVHNRAGSNMSWGVATALLEQRGNEGLFEVDEAWLPRMVGRARPAPDRARQPLPRPARPLRRARAASPTSGRRWSSRAPAAPASCSTPTTRWSPTSAATASCERREGVTYFGIEDPRRRCPSSSTPTTPSTAAAAAPRTPTSAPSSATSATTRARTATPTAPSPTSPRPRSSCDGMAGSRVDGPHPEGEVELELPLPGLYNVYNALAALAAALRLGVALERRGRRAASGRGRRSAASRRSRSAGKPVSILLIKNPAGANEVLRTLRLEAAGDGRRRLDLWIALNDRIADGRDVSWIWDADFELLAGARAAGRLRRHPGARDGACGSSTRASTRG